MINLNKVVVQDDNRSNVVTLGEELFCKAYKDNDYQYMNKLIKKDISCNSYVVGIFTEIISKRNYSLLKELLDGAYVSANYNYRGEHLLNLILNDISIYNKNKIELGSCEDMILREIFNNIKLDDIKNYTLINILTTDLFHSYLNILVDRGFDFKNSCILQLSSRDGDDCFISEATHGLDNIYNIVDCEVLDRRECEQLYQTFIKYPDVAMNIATLYPEQFLYCNNEFDDTDSIGFLRSEIDNLKSMGLKIYAFRDISSNLDDIFTIFRG